MKALWMSLLLLLPLPALAAPADILPPALEVRAVLAQTPRVRMARSVLEQERAQSRRLDAGPYEWTPSIDINNRRVSDGPTYMEQSISVSRGFRWFGKAGKDRQIGQLGIDVGELTVADAWHESARTLLSRWFTALRTGLGVRRLQAERKLAEQQLGATKAMVGPGEVRKLDAMLAQADLDKLGAQLQQAQLAADNAVIELQAYYPGLSIPGPVALPPPPQLKDGHRQWVDRILGDNHEIELAQAEATRSNDRAERAGLDRIPDPTVGAHYWMERNGHEKVGGIQISIPIPGDERRAAYQEAQARASGMREAVRDTQQRVAAVARQVALQAQLSPRVWQQLDAVATQAAHNAALMFEAYQLGETGLTEVLTARRQSEGARAAADNAAIDAWEAHTRLLLDTHRIWSMEDAHAAAQAQSGLAMSPEGAGP